jgi:hypothetical protein
MADPPTSGLSLVPEVVSNNNQIADLHVVRDRFLHGTRLGRGSAQMS